MDCDGRMGTSKPATTDGSLAVTCEKAQERARVGVVPITLVPNARTYDRNVTRV